MTDRAQELLREVLTLPVDKRADVAAELLASLDELATMDQAAVEAAWAREIERRAGRVMSGESVGEPWEDVRARVARRLLMPKAGFDALLGTIETDLGALSDEFDATLARMQTSGARDAMQRAFGASPEELGKASVAAARRRG